MRIAIAGLFHESNTFCRPPTTLADYERDRLYVGEAMLAPLRGTQTEIGGILRAAERLGIEVVPTFYAWAWPGGPLTAECFQTLLEGLTEALARAGPLDGALLQVHGAMVAEGDDDPDGTAIAAARSCLEPGARLGVTCDFHANLSPLMVSSCDLLVGYNTYPHVDLAECGEECATLLVRTLRGEIRPTMALAKPPLMPHIVRQRTEDGPMAELMALARAAERERGVLRVTIAGGFAYADVPRVGMGIVAITDNDPELAAEIAHRLADAAWERRRAFTAAPPGPEEAVRLALAVPPGRGPVVLADIGDNIGGGSPGDGTVLLRELLAHDPRGALVMLCDPAAVGEAIAAGVRSRVALLVGGKTDRLHGEPIALTAIVRRIADGIYRNRGPMRDGLVDDMGRTVVLDVDGLTLVLTERRVPQWNLEQFRSLGIDPKEQRIVVCKGAVAHRAAYGPIAAAMIDVDTPGACAGDLRRFRYAHLRRPLYPLDEW